MMGLREKQDGKEHVTHTKYYENMKKSRNQLLIIENVCEYEEQMVQKELGGEWCLKSIRVDPRALGLPCARARVFILAWKKKELRWCAPWTLSSFVEALCSRIGMNTGNYFFKKLPEAKLTRSLVR